MAAPVVPSLIANEPLNKHNYKEWKLRVKTYLQAKGLYSVVKDASDPPQKGRYKREAWQKTNAEALHAIHLCCRNDAFQVIKPLLFRGCLAVAEWVWHVYCCYASTLWVPIEVLLVESWPEWSPASFEVGGVPFNPDGWGPPDCTLNNVPYAPFSRFEKLGRIADWTRTFNIPSRSKNPSDTVFDFSNDESFLGNADDDSSFRLVDGKPPPRPKFGPRWRFQQQKHLPHRRDEEVEAKKREAEKERGRRDRHYISNRSNVHLPHREAAVCKSSVDIQPEWNMLDQIPFSAFSKLSFTVPEPEDLLFCGALESYDRTVDRITPKNERRLVRWFKNRNFSIATITTSDDPVIRRLANEDKATVFATDTILSTLMIL
ncbi:hypothetical protein ACLB2K_058295 [Fragaria x ananassa]